ncbi:MAG: metal ABC transporter permease [Treponema sp.]|jgi:zinc transport system permease protein|nr:metal ABC transporter permease [Treponema sp.]
MIDVLKEMFGYTFLARAVLVGSMVSVCAALLGVSLVLKRYSMIGDGLSHVGFGALALATALNAAPLTVAIPVVVAAAFLLLRVSENSKIKGDAAIALISTGSLAVGVVIISRTTGMNTDVCNYLFGSILAMNKTDVYLSTGLSAAVLILFITFYNKLFAITFDETFAKASGIKTGLYNMLIALLTALTIVLGMRMMGAMLISSLIIFPALSSMRIFKKFKSVTVCSALISIGCFFVGVVISYIYATPTGASVVMINIIVFVLFWLAGNFRRPFPASVCAVFALCVFMLSGCGSGRTLGAKTNKAGTLSVKVPESVLQKEPEKIASNSGGDIIEIKEKMYIAQTNDIYLNTEDYLGKMIKLEGLFKEEYFGEREDPYCFVLRYGPGCCGTDGNAGFEVAWENDLPSKGEYPKVDDWVEATGTLKTYEEDGYPYLYISLSQLKVLDERGAEFVTQ